MGRERSLGIGGEWQDSAQPHISTNQSSQDTLAAGDTFNAGVLHALKGGRSLEEALELGCRVAGQKVGKVGLKIDTTVLDL